MRGFYEIRVRATAVAISAFALVLVAVPAAQANLVSILPGSCNEPVSQPFAHYGDTNDYFLVPGGLFNAGEVPWGLVGGCPGGIRFVVAARWKLRHQSGGLRQHLRPDRQAVRDEQWRVVVPVEGRSPLSLRSSEGCRRHESVNSAGHRRGSRRPSSGSR